MTPYFKSLLYAFGLLLVGSIIGSVLFGCASPPPRAALPGAGSCINGPHSYRTTPDGAKWYLDCVNQPQTAHDPAQSWDQANLKAHDKGCPTAIFVAPGGNLTQCQALDDQAATPTASSDEVRFFPTITAAALYVVGKIYEHSHYYEFGGVIVKATKGYAISLPHTQHHGMDVNIDEDPDSYDYAIVATYHVHPCLKNAFPSVFSPQDLAGARATNHPAYVLDECTGELHYWAPGDGYLDADAMLKLGVNPMMLAHGVQLSPGKIVGKIAVDGIVLN
jgi:hypothetical protein